MFSLAHLVTTGLTLSILWIWILEPLRYLFRTKSTFLSYIFIDSRDQNERDKQNRFLRQAVFLSRELVPLERFSENFCHHFSGTCSTRKFSKDKLFHPFFKSFNYIQSVSKIKENNRQLLPYIFFWLVSPSKFVLPFMEFSIYGKNYLISMLKKFRHFFVGIAIVKLIQFLRHFQTILSNCFWNAFAQSKNEVTCEICDTSTTRINLALLERCCSVGLIYCSNCTIFYPKSQSDLNYHIPKKHSAQKKRRYLLL